MQHQHEGRLITVGPKKSGSYFAYTKFKDKPLPKQWWHLSLTQMCQKVSMIEDFGHFHTKNGIETKCTELLMLIVMLSQTFT